MCVKERIGRSKDLRMVNGSSPMREKAGVVRVSVNPPSGISQTLILASSQTVRCVCGGGGGGGGGDTGRKSTKCFHFPLGKVCWSGGLRRESRMGQSEHQGWQGRPHTDHESPTVSAKQTTETDQEEAAELTTLKPEAFPTWKALLSPGTVPLILSMCVLRCMVWPSMCRSLEERTIWKTFGGGLRGLPPSSIFGSDTCAAGGSVEEHDGLVLPWGVACLTGLLAAGSVVFLDILAGF